MKSFQLLLVGLVLAAGSAIAQTESSKTAIGLHFGTMQYRGDIGSEYFSSEALHAAGSVSLAAYVSPSFDLQVDVSHGIIDMQADHFGTVRSFNTSLIAANFSMKYKLANGKLLNSNFPVQPFLMAGLGDVRSSASHYKHLTSREVGGETKTYLTPRNRMDFSFNLGFGVSMSVGETLMFSLSSVHNYVMSDNLDNYVGGKYLDEYIYHSLGLIYCFNRK